MAQMEFLITVVAIHFAKPLMHKCGIMGKDLHKIGKPSLPESMGMVASFVFLSFLEPCPAFWCSLWGLWIGSLDDIFDLRWRTKLAMTAVTGLLLQPNTTVRVLSVNLGAFYHAYVGLWCIWCGNAINIHAGINGLEVGQCLVIAVGLGCHRQHQSLTSYIAVCVGLLVHNWYPASVFVGDSWCYMSGMFFVAYAMHNTETLAIIMLPQICNTLVSLPELVGVCPRHRMPLYDPKSDKLAPSDSWTLMNLTLRLCGPMREQTLCVTMLVLQAMCVCLSLFMEFSSQS